MTNPLYEEWQRCFERFRRTHGFDLRDIESPLEKQDRVLRKLERLDRAMAPKKPNPPWIDNRDKTK